MGPFSQSISKILQRYAELFIADNLWVPWLSASLFLAFVVYPRSKQAKSSSRLALFIALPLAMSVVYWAYQLRWVGDDAFISYRYAQNLVQGQGLVFNPGERVEGYTNFLWTLLIAGGLYLGINPILFSLSLSLLSLAAIILLTSLMSAEEPVVRRRDSLPLAAVALSSSYLLANFGTSGLETIFAAFLVLLTLYFARKGAFFLAGLSGVFAAMSHPDHLIFYGAMGLVLLLQLFKNIRGASVKTTIQARAAFARSAFARYALPLFLFF